MTLTQMNYIITISETGSLNKAAEALYISQPSLTNAVKELEKELGIIIFNRSGRGVTLTNDGTEFLMYARQIYGQYESVVEKYSEGGSILGVVHAASKNNKQTILLFLILPNQIPIIPPGVRHPPGYML